MICDYCREVLVIKNNGWVHKNGEKIKEESHGIPRHIVNPVHEDKFMTKQKEYCRKRGIPLFVPEDGKCWHCKRIIPDNGEKHITGCPHCSESFCE